MSPASWLGIGLSMVGCAEESGHSGAPAAAPEATIGAPKEAQVFHEGDVVPLRGFVGDSIDAPPDLEVTWTLDGTEPIETLVAADGTVTGEVDTTGLDLREHVVRLQAVDADSDTAFAHVGFFLVGPAGPPLVEILTPADPVVADLGVAVSVPAAASDDATPTQLLSFEWSSDLDGVLGPGARSIDGSTLITDTLSVGTHVVALEVTDEDGEVAADTIGITIVEPPVTLFACGRFGQTFIYEADFDWEVPIEFSGPASAVDVEGWDGLGFGDFVFEGRMAQNTTDPPRALRLDLDDLPPHDTISIAFLFAMIDSWDGNNWGAGPDGFEVSVDGDPVFSHVFAACCGTSDYVPPPGVLLSWDTQLGFNSLPDMSHDAAYDMTLEPAFRDIPHTGSSVSIEWTATGAQWQGGTDESWAIDALCVSVAE